MAIGEPTRSSRLRWVIVVDAALSPGTAVNTVACVAAHVGRAVSGLLGPDGTDAGGAAHPGLPWAGCTVLAASADELTEIRRKADAAGDVDVCDTPASAQTNRVYAEYLAELSRTQDDALQLRALSLFGPKEPHQQAHRPARAPAVTAPGAVALTEAGWSRPGRRLVQVSSLRVATSGSS